jgi:ribosomal protein S18 acetylase RimI-like enzyme
MVILRKAVDDDIQGIWDLNALIRPREPITTLKAVFSQPETVAWVMIDNFRVVGALVGKTKFSLPYIHSIAVEPSYRRQRWASKLVNEFELHFSRKGKGNYWLQVRHDNPAQKLYFDLGYRVESVDENFYGPELHGLCMYKRP